MSDDKITFIEQMSKDLSDQVYQTHGYVNRQLKMLDVVDPHVRPLIRRLADLPSAGHIKNVRLSVSYDEAFLAEVTLALDPTFKDSPILREIVKAGIVSRIDKVKSWDDKSLNASFDLGAIKVVIAGYLPESCRIEETPVVVTAPDDYFIEDGVVKRRTVERKVVCTETPTPDPDADLLAHEPPLDRDGDVPF